ncbi:MAG: hypothetical protein KFF68_13600 [Desulfosarcina sp.]|nr:hypothetical protein [Desulfosarcina sp.]
MTWTMDKHWRSEDLRELEEKVNLSPVTNMLSLCQSKLGRFSGKEAMLAIDALSLITELRISNALPVDLDR